jgi:hypothetical protein
VFWGGCVVFWCSFWVGFWLSESLRGVLTPARNGRLQSPLEQGGRGYGSGGILPAKSPFGAPNKGGWYIPLSKTTQEKPFFEHPLPPLTKPYPFGVY